MEDRKTANDSLFFSLHYKSDFDYCSVFNDFVVLHFSFATFHVKRFNILDC